MSGLPYFKLEAYLDTREFTASYMLCGSDMQTRSVKQLLALEPDALEKYISIGLDYPAPQGNIELREQITKIYRSCTINNILCFAGAEEGIYAAMRSLLEKNDHVITLVPCYESLKLLPETFCQVTTVPVELDQEKNWFIDIGKIKKAIQPNTKMIVVNFPHNPTGFIPTHAFQQELIHIARQCGAYIFCDEVNRFLEHDPSLQLPNITDVYEKGISLNVMSKSWGLPGLRIGWIACQEINVIKKLRDYKHYLSICNSAPSEYLSILALKHKERIFSENISLLLKNKKILKDYLLSRPDLFQWLEPKGTCVCYPGYHGYIPIDKLADDLFSQYGLVILPSSVMNDTQNHFRISYGRANFTEAFSYFKAYINEKMPIAEKI